MGNKPGRAGYLSVSGISTRRSCFCVEPLRVRAAREEKRRDNSLDALSTTPWGQIKQFGQQGGRTLPIINIL